MKEEISVDRDFIFKTELSVSEYQIIMEGLRELPAKHSFDLLQRLGQEFYSQVQLSKKPKIVESNWDKEVAAAKD